MPVIGDTTELPLPDLLGMLRYRTGVVTFTSIQNLPEMRMHVTPGWLGGLLLGGRLVKSEIHILDILVAVAASPAGRFHFQATLPQELLSDVRISIDGLILAVVTNIDEILGNLDRLPHADQVYSFVPGKEELQYDDPTLADFLLRARDQLELGVSAETVADILHISDKQAQFYLLKLREYEMIQPMRSVDPFLNNPSLQLKSTQLRVREHQIRPAASPVSSPQAAVYKHSEGDQGPPPLSGKITRMI